MKLRFLVLALLSGTMLGQGVRHDSNATTTSKNVPSGASANIMTVPNAIVTICGFPAVGSPCTNTVPLFADNALTQPIDNPVQADAQGRWGFWVAPGVYTYTIQTQTGTVVGNYSLSLNTIGISASPSTGQAVQQPTGTSLDSNIFNHVFNASMFPGADIGAKVNAAISALVTAYGGGKVEIPGGSYSFSTTMVVPQRIKLFGHGDGTQLNYTGTGAAIALSNPCVPSPGCAAAGADVIGYLEDLQLIGSDTAGTIGVWQGGDDAGVIRPATDIGYNYSIQRVNISHFGTGIEWGHGVFNVRWYDVESNHNLTYGWYYPNTATVGGQNNNFYHSTLKNNAGGGFFVNQLPEVTFSMHGMDIEYNGNLTAFGGPAQMQGGNYQCFDCHVESFFGPLVTIFPNAGFGGFYGGFFYVADFSLEPYVVQLLSGTNGVLFESAIIQLQHAHTEFINQVAGSNTPTIWFKNNTFLITNPATITNSTGLSVAVCSGGTCADHALYTTPVGTVTDSSISLSSLPTFAGTYMLWNKGPGTPGNADWVNSFNGSASATTGHLWWVNNGGTYTSIMNLHRNGNLFLNGSIQTNTNFAVSGIAGISHTISLPCGTATFTGGILTSVTGTC